jgi:hypothetical protein
MVRLAPQFSLVFDPDVDLANEDYAQHVINALNERAFQYANDTFFRIENIKQSEAITKVSGKLVSMHGDVPKEIRLFNAKNQLLAKVSLSGTRKSSFDLSFTSAKSFGGVRVEVWGISRFHPKGSLRTLSMSDFRGLHLAN